MRLTFVPILSLSSKRFFQTSSKVMSCCPPNAEKYLEATYATVGQTQSLSNGHEFYSTGSVLSKKAVIVIPDVFGWHAGRTRNVADWFAEAGYYTVVPKLMVPALEGGTDGDGLYPTFDFATDGHKFPGFLHSVGWTDVLRPRLMSVTQHIKEQGITQIHLIGFCWGGWVGCKALADSEMAGDYLSLAIPHPSVTLEERVYGGNSQELIDRVQKPVYFMPAKGDPDEYRETGTLYLTLKARLPSSRTLDFAGQEHGFVPRGDVNNAETREAVELALSTTHAFFKEHETA